MKVPFLDLKAQHAPLRREIDHAIGQVIDEAAFAGGPFVVQFEADFAAYCNCPYAIAVGSGTDALWLSLLALGVGPGDEVITVANSFMATAEAISYCGARPVFVDVDERSYTMDPAALTKALTARTKAIIPVHLYGQPADMDPILKFADQHGLFVVEDACQAHGAEYKGRRVGTLGNTACFSFYPGKNLGAFGEAGAVVTNDAELMDKIRILRDHGQVRKYYHSMIGWNCRMDGIQAAVLSVKLRHLEKGNELRRSHAAHYDQTLAGLEELITPLQSAFARHVYHIYPICVQQRDEVMQFLHKNGIGSGIHYPVPIHLQEAYRSLGYERGAFPVAERCANQMVSLPMFPELTPAQVETVAQCVKEAVSVCALA
jgi:dTDP-4-amino-4,6-dideoxygalactose transaminase